MQFFLYTFPIESSIVSEKAGGGDGQAISSSIAFFLVSLVGWIQYSNLLESGSYEINLFQVLLVFFILVYSAGCF